MEDLDYIYKHFTAGLTEQEQEAFDARLNSDAGFRSQVSEYQFIFEGLKGMRHQHFLNAAQSWKAELLAKSLYEPVEAIQSYLAGTMEAPEKSAFEARLREEPELAARLEEYRPIVEGLKAMRAAAFHQKVKHWAEELKVSPSPSPKQVRRLPLQVFRYAAAVVLLLGLGFAGSKWYAVSNFSTDALVAQHYHPRKTPATLSDQDNAFQDGFKAYTEKDFPAAIAFFSRVPKASPRYAEAQLFLGYAYFESAQFPAAVQAFQEAIASQDRRFTDNAEWHLLLSYFRQNPSGAEFEALLNTLAQNPQHSFHGEAVELRASLNSFWRKLAGG